MIAHNCVVCNCMCVCTCNDSVSMYDYIMMYVRNYNGVMLQYVRMSSFYTYTYVHVYIRRYVHTYVCIILYVCTYTSMCVPYV